MTELSQEVLLARCVRAVVKHDDIHPIRNGNESRRVRVRILSDYPEENRLIKYYYVWITEEYVHLNYKDELSDELASKIALGVVQKRFTENNNETPIEDGISLSDSEEIIVDPKKFTHPLAQ